ncbi:MAG TPA: hypothetical protein VF230_00995 [Acidimicrobiales bacterium]
MRRVSRLFLVAAFVTGAALLGACTGDGDDTARPASNTSGSRELASRTVEAGEVTVEVTP